MQDTSPSANVGLSVRYVQGKNDVAYFAGMKVAKKKKFCKFVLSTKTREMAAMGIRENLFSTSK